MKFVIRIGLLFLMGIAVLTGFSQSHPFYIKNYKVRIQVNKDASLNVEETIHAYFNEEKHGIIRDIPYKYPLQELPLGVDSADLQLVSGHTLRTIVDQIKVSDWKYKVSESGNNKSIRIGSPDEYIKGDQEFRISYKVKNAINFFKDGHSEFYFNVIGHNWDVPIEKVDFKIQLFKPLPDSTEWFIATGSYGSKNVNAVAHWFQQEQLAGMNTKVLEPYNGVTVGFKMPENFLTRPDYSTEGLPWLFVPMIVFVFMFVRWYKYGKDDKVIVQTEFYPPQGVSPSISGYMVDGVLNQRDLTALVPYWGAAGCLQIKELESKKLLGLIKSKDYEFIKLKDLPVDAPRFEKTMFNGLFVNDTTLLSDLKDKFYVTMASAKAQLEDEIKKNEFYVKKSKIGCLFTLLMVACFIWGIKTLTKGIPENLWLGGGLIASGIIIIIFGALMRKKTPKGNELYAKLLGFKEFLKSVEKDRLREFLKQDENYFDKILPYAIVFNIADTWKDKLKGLDVPPPSWYSGHYANGYSTGAFMNNLNQSMNSMSSNFYSSPHQSGGSSGSSGGSFSGGGGFSGGGFGGGGGSSW